VTDIRACLRMIAVATALIAAASAAHAPSLMSGRVEDQRTWS